MSLPPCIRHGDRNVADPRIIAALDQAMASGPPGLADQIRSLVDYDGQLWVTWRDVEARRSGAQALASAWGRLGGERGALHLVRSDEDFDYQEDCMNDAQADT